MSGWTPTSLSAVLVDASPGFACGDDVDDGVFQFRMNNVTSTGQLDFTKKRRVPRNTRNIDKYLVDRGDVLFNATNSPDLVGKTAFFPGLDEPAVLSNHFLRLRPDSDRLDGRFLARWLNLQFERGRFAGMCRQWVNQAAVNRDALLAMQMPLPPVHEQRRIAAILDKADALRAKRRAALAKLDALTQSIFLHFRCSSVANLCTIPLSNAADATRGSFVNGPFGSDLLTNELQDEGVPVIYIRDIRNGEYLRVSRVSVSERKARELAVCAVQGGDVLLAKVGDPPGIAAVYPTGEPAGIVTQDVVRIRVAREVAVPEFLAAYLNSSIGKQKVAGITVEATRARFSLKDLKRVTIELPPVELQLEFARRVAAVDELKAKYRSSLAEQNALFASLQHRAFRGEL
jgi:type I restriction enzyme, S subunit